MGKTKDYKPSKGVQIITQNKTLISCVAILLYMVITVVVYFWCKKDLEDTSYAMQVISGIFVVGGLVVSVLQYTASCVENTILRNQERKTKAAEMANKFQEDLIPLMNIISEAYTDSKLSTTVLEKISNANLEMFNKEEVLDIISEEEKKEILPKLQSAYLVKNYKPHNIVVDPETGKTLKVEYDEKDINEAQHIIKSALTKLANSLEYFSMYFNSGIADDDTVYQSLHGVFFKCVNMIYPFAFYGNKKESDRLFSNTSSLYIRWSKIHEELAEEEKLELKELKNKLKDKIVVKVKE